MNRLVFFILIGGLLIIGNISIGLAEETDGGGSAAEYPVVSPDGTKILFESPAGNSTAIWIANRDGSDARPLIHLGDSDASGADWSPDGSRIAFASNKGGAMNVWTAASNGTDLKQLTTGDGENRHPRFSPDGSTLLFLSKRSGKNEIWLMSSTGGTAKTVGFISLRVSSPSWSPDGKTIVYSGCSGDACNLFTIARDGSTFSQVTNGTFNDWEPTWSVQGIAFSSNRGGNGFGIWIVQPNGSQLRQLAERGAEPRWDRIGGLVFTRTSDDDDLSEGDVWNLGLDGRSNRVTRISGLLSAGDINGDGITNCTDLALVRASFGKSQGQASFDSRADLDGNGLVNVKDLATVSQKLPANTVCK